VRLARPHPLLACFTKSKLLEHQHSQPVNMTEEPKTNNYNNSNNTTAGASTAAGKEGQQSNKKQGGGKGGGGRGGGGRGAGRGGRGRGRGGRGRGGGRSSPSPSDDAAGSATGKEQEKGSGNSDKKGGKGSDDSQKTGGGGGLGGGGGGGRGAGRGGAKGRGRGGQQQQNDNDEKKNKNNSNKSKGQKQENKQPQEKQGSNPKTQQPAKQKHDSGGKQKKNDPSSAEGAAANATMTKPKLAPSIPPNQPQQTSDLDYGRGEAIVVLHVAEKPSIAQAIAKGLAPNGSAQSRSSKSLPVYEFSDPPFPKAPRARRCDHRVTSVAGHVFSVDFPAQYQSWDAVDPAELFEAPVVRKPCKGSVCAHLAAEARGVDFIVLWMDCDREGENINYEVLDCCMHLMKSGRGNDTNFARVYRAHFSAINPSDIQSAYQKLGKPDQNQALSVDARQELDLKVGVAFSRFQTRYFQGRYGDLDSAVLSYGPCQTPYVNSMRTCTFLLNLSVFIECAPHLDFFLSTFRTLGFCVQRHIDIETFKPEPYWVLELGIVKRGRRLRALWDAGRSFNRNKVEQLQLKALSESPSVAIVQNVVSKDKKQGRPVPLNTVALLKACSKALGIGPHQALQTAERLYLSGYLSYPRTESSAYPKSFDIAGTLRSQSSDNRWGKYVRDLLQQGHNNSRGGIDMGDHPPITPCRPAGPGELSGDMARVYDLVVRHFIASVSPDAVWRSTKIDFAIESIGDKGTFTLRGKQIVSEGFLAVLLHREYGDEARQDGDEDNEDEEDREIPPFSAGEVIPLSNSSLSSSAGAAKLTVIPGEAVMGTLEMKEKVTTPPGYLTESELIGLMEKVRSLAHVGSYCEKFRARSLPSD